MSIAGDQLRPAEMVLPFSRVEVAQAQANKAPHVLTDGTVAIFDSGMVVLRGGGVVMATHLSRCIIWHQEE